LSDLDFLVGLFQHPEEENPRSPGRDPENGRAALQAVQGDESLVEGKKFLDLRDQPLEEERMRRDYVLGRVWSRDLNRDLHRNLGGLSLSHSGRRRPGYVEGLIVGSGIGVLGAAILEWLGLWTWLAGIIWK
jgi:hypothetical protein